MRTPPSIAFNCRVSRTLVAATIAVSLLAIFAVSVSGSPQWLRSTLAVLVVAFGSAALIRMFRRRIRSLLWRGDGGVEIRLRGSALEDEREVQGSVHSARVMGPLIVLALRWPPREHASLWLLPDNLDPDTRRRLRMRLNTGAGGFESGNADSG